MYWKIKSKPRAEKRLYVLSKRNSLGLLILLFLDFVFARGFIKFFFVTNFKIFALASFLPLSLLLLAGELKTVQLKCLKIFLFKHNCVLMNSRWIVTVASFEKIHGGKNSLYTLTITNA